MRVFKIRSPSPKWSIATMMLLSGAAVWDCGAAGDSSAPGGIGLGGASGGAAGSTSTGGGNGGSPEMGGSSGSAGGGGSSGLAGTGGSAGAAGAGGSAGAAGAGGSAGAGGRTAIDAASDAKGSGGADAAARRNDAGAGIIDGSAGTRTDAASTGGASGGMSTAGITCTPQNWAAAPVGWASTSGGTTGGGNASPVTVTSLSQLNSAARGSSPAVIHISGKLSGTAQVGSNKTILGLCGAEISGSIDLTGSSNVIIRNLTVVGFNCSDNSACSGGADAIHVESGARHLWFDHLDVSNGSDGNLDITHGSDLVTISWTKFHYSGRRSGGHQFCNLIGHDDGNGAEDTGRLNVTFDHVWWAENVDQRMPRVRFGKVHVFNSLYTASGDSACVEVGVSCNIRLENSVFSGVSNAIDSTHADGASIIQSIGNQSANRNIGGSAFVPPYSYALDPTASVSAAVMAGAGPK